MLLYYKMNSTTMDYETLHDYKKINSKLVNLTTNLKHSTTIANVQNRQGYIDLIMRHSAIEALAVENEDKRFPDFDGDDDLASRYPKER